MPRPTRTTQAPDKYTPTAGEKPKFRNQYHNEPDFWVYRMAKTDEWVLSHRKRKRDELGDKGEQMPLRVMREFIIYP